MDFEFKEDKKYFVELLAGGDVTLFEKKYRHLFDFRSPQIKRKEFSQNYASLERDLIRRQGDYCNLQLSEDCTLGEELVIDHLIPLSTNRLNKKLRNIVPDRGKKIRSQSFGSNHPDNLVRACRKCNRKKFQKILEKNVIRELLEMKNLTHPHER